MSSRLEQLASRRRLLQLQCAVQRGEIGEIQAGIDAGAARADRVIAVVRRLSPLLAVAGVLAVAAVGPSRLLGTARSVLPAVLVAQRALRLLR